MLTILKDIGLWLMLVATVIAAQAAAAAAAEARQKARRREEIKRKLGNFHVTAGTNPGVF